MFSQLTEIVLEPGGLYLCCDWDCNFYILTFCKTGIHGESAELNWRTVPDLKVTNPPMLLMQIDHIQAGEMVDNIKCEKREF